MHTRYSMVYTRKFGIIIYGKHMQRPAVYAKQRTDVKVSFVSSTGYITAFLYSDGMV